MYAFNADLFKVDGVPIAFFIADDVENKHYLKTYVESAGGVVAENAFGPYTIIISDHCSDNTYGAREAYRGEFITQSCMKNQLSLLRDFRVVKDSPFISEFDPTDVLAQIISWPTAIEKFSRVVKETPASSFGDKIIIINGVVPKVVLRKIDLSDLDKPAPINSREPEEKASYFNTTSRKEMSSSSTETSSSSSDEEADTPKPKVRKPEGNSSLSESSEVEENETSLRKQTKPDVMISDNCDSVSHVNKCIEITLSSDEEIDTPQPSVRKQTRNSSQSDSSDLEKPETKVKFHSRKQTRKPNVKASSSSDSDSFDEKQVTKPSDRNMNINNKKKQVMQRARREYTLDDDNRIIEYIKAHPRNRDKLGGIDFWKTMERRSILCGRSWQSLKERWRKRISPRINLDSLYRSASAAVQTKASSSAQTKTSSNRDSTTSAPQPGPPTSLSKGPVQHQAYPEKKAPVIPVLTSNKPNSNETNVDSAEPEKKKKKKKFRLLPKSFEDATSPKPSDQFPTPISIKRPGPSTLECLMRNHGINLARKKQKLPKIQSKNPLRKEATKIPSDEDSSVDESETTNGYAPKNKNCHTSKNLHLAALTNEDGEESIYSLRLSLTPSPDQEREHQNSRKEESNIENELLSTSSIDEDGQETMLCKSPDKGEEGTDRGAGERNASQKHMNNIKESSQHSYDLFSSEEPHDLPVNSQVNHETNSVSLSPRYPSNVITPEEIVFETQEHSDSDVSSCKDLTEDAVRRRLMIKDKRIPLSPERIDFAADTEQESHERCEDLNESPERLAFDAVPEVDKESHSSWSGSDDGLSWRGSVPCLTKKNKLCKTACSNKIDELQEQSEEGEAEVLDSSSQNGLNRLDKSEEPSEEDEELDLLDPLGTMSPQVGSESFHSSAYSPLSCNFDNKSTVMIVLSPKSANPLRTESPHSSSQTSVPTLPSSGSGNNSAVINVPPPKSANPLSTMSPQAGSCSLSQTSNPLCVSGSESAVINVNMEPSKSAVCNVDIDDSVCDNSLTQSDASDPLSENLMGVSELAESTGTRNNIGGGSCESQQNSSLVKTGEVLPASAADLSVSHSSLEDGSANHLPEENDFEERVIMVQARELKIKDASTSPINWSVEEKSLVSETANRNECLKHNGRLPAKSKSKRKHTSETPRRSAHVSSEEESLYPASPVPGDFQCSGVKSPIPAKCALKANRIWL